MTGHVEVKSNLTASDAMKTLICTIHQPGKGCAKVLPPLFMAMAFFLVGHDDALARGLGVGGGGAGGGGLGGGRPGVGVGGVGAGAARVGAVGVAGVGAAGIGVAPGVGVGAPGVGVLPRGYYAALPVAAAAYTTAVYNGQTCQYGGGVYYCPAMYQGTTVWVATP